MLGEQSLRRIAGAVLRRCAPYRAEVHVYAEDRALTRFANNYIHQNVAERDVTVLIRLRDGEGRLGMAVTNRLDDAALDEAVARAKQAVQVSPPDPEFPGLTPPAEYAQVQAFDEATAGFAPEKRADAVGLVCRLAKEQGLVASGAFSTGYSEMVIANSEGLVAYHTGTGADFQTVVMSEDSSGRAQSTHWRVAVLDPEALGREAVEKAVRGRNPRPIDPGEYTVVLDPYATADLMQMLNFYGMGALSVQEGRSWMSGRIGKQAMSPLVTLVDDGLDPRGVPMPFDFEGTPKQRVVIVDRGVVQGPVYDRRTAAKEGRSSTGHALPPTARGLGPVAMHLFLEPGETSTEDLIRSTERGLYITRFWYTRLVHPRDCVVTGMTRDGVFFIENGEITYPVKNLRFTQGYVPALASVQAVGSETRLLLNEFLGGGVLAPALKIESFHFTGMTV